MSSDTPPDPALVEAAVARHDRDVAARGLVIWLGAEPTFTDRSSEHPAWLYHALGDDKEARAGRLLAALHAPGGALLRTLGRQYPGEDQPRWSLGRYARRDGQTCWDGPPDPLLLPSPPDVPLEAVEHLWRELDREITARGWRTAPFTCAGEAAWRIVFSRDGHPPLADPSLAPGLARRSVHDTAVPREGPVDTLALQGNFLLALGRRCFEPDGPPLPFVELPGLPSASCLLDVLGLLARAARAAELPCLVLRGFPPPVDASVCWTTLTPDPAVLEVNLAPTATAAEFHQTCRRLHAAAAARGLTPYRLHYNGAVADSGGGGHLTLGGPSPADSPFFRQPHLLPRLVRYFLRHPALSYWFAAASVGPSGQFPRPDEGLPIRTAELRLALELLDRLPRPTPEDLDRALRPFLADPSGNTHRSEINIEKLANPALPGRGSLGLVEFRAFRMARGPDEETARACLLRAIVAFLAVSPPPPALAAWGETLHDRFALPHFLRQDFREVLAELRAAGFGLDGVLADLLADDPSRRRGAVDFEGCRLEVEQALEFWPLVGDVASQETGGSRLVDASTSRVQVLLRPLDGAAAPLAEWRLQVGRTRVPLGMGVDPTGPVRLVGLRFRTFTPHLGLHPTLPPLDPVQFTLGRPGLARHLVVRLHDWHPQGLAYPGLPASLDEARDRRLQRMLTTVVPGDPPGPERGPPAGAVTPWCLDLRWLPRD